MNNNILILIPGENARGGITNYYASIRKHLPNNIIYFKRGSRNWPNNASLLQESLRIIKDYLNFIYCLLLKKVAIVQTTTAFYRGSIIRDGIFILIAQLLGKKTIVFFRGWNDQYVYGLSGLALKLFKFVYFRTDAIIDLSEHNVEFLKKMGYTKKIYLETTVVDINLLEDIKIESLIDHRIASDKKTVLFLSRVEKSKGIYKLLEIYKELKLRDDNYELIIAGDGTELENLERKVLASKVKDIKITGFVEGKSKQDYYKKASVFVFLSDFEGMPNAVLEAMAFGLPVITTNVGGIASVFTDKENGFLIDTYSKDQIAENISYLFANKDFYKKLSLNNAKKAEEQLMSNVVAKRMMTIFEDVNFK